MTGKPKYEMDMCSGAVLPKLLLFSLPLMVSSVLQLLFNAADIVVVGRFAGDNALAAVGATSSLISLLTEFFLGFSIGANIIAARQYGGGKQAEMAKTVRTASPKPQQNENPKYAMRTWLLRLGFIGDEFKTARDLFTKRLDGDAAFRNGRAA